jgi:hypothetical protein
MQIFGPRCLVPAFTVIDLSSSSAIGCPNGVSGGRRTIAMPCRADGAARHLRATPRTFNFRCHRWGS